MAAGPEPGGECGICYEAFWGSGGAPQELPCRHSLCRRCLLRLLRRSAAPLLTCPFCRTVALLPQGLPPGPDAAPAPGTPRGGEEEEEERGEGGAAPAGSGRRSPRPVALEVEGMCPSHGPVFAVSSSVSPCGARPGSEAPGAFVLGLLGRGVLLDTQPPLASMENLRLGFAAGILVLIVSTFFLLVFLK